MSTTSKTTSRAVLVVATALAFAGATAGIATAATGTTTGNATATKPDTSVVYVDPAHNLVKRPSSIELAAGDGGDTLSRLSWTRWDTGKAVATGLETVNDCVPNCAAGKSHTERVTVELRAAKPFADRGEQYFTKAVVHDGSGDRVFPVG